MLVSGTNYNRRQKYKKGYVHCLTAIISIGGFQQGYDIGIMSGAQLFLKDTWPSITTEQKEFAVSLALLGAVFGTLIAGPLADKYGRKPVIIASCILYTVGALIVACA